ncbi:MAG TPA: STM3941 family protein [Pyrinomonadaceae bacterium]|nr:STM3941 family protein [Pyrinomonadaceae bacterium]
MSRIEIRINRSYKWQLVLIVFGCVILLYFYLGDLPVELWVLGGLVVVFLLYKVVRGESKDPCIVLDDEGVFDRRLKIGVISWDDIRKIKLYDRDEGRYISIELHNAQKYQARQPAWMRLISMAHRLHGMSATSISTNGLDMDRHTLAHKIQEGCERVSHRTVLVE